MSPVAWDKVLPERDGISGSSTSALTGRAGNESQRQLSGRAATWLPRAPRRCSPSRASREIPVAQTRLLTRKTRPLSVIMTARVGKRSHPHRNVRIVDVSTGILHLEVARTLPRICFDGTQVPTDPVSLQAGAPTEEFASGM